MSGQTPEQRITAIAEVIARHQRVPENFCSANIRGMCRECRNGPWTSAHVAAEVDRTLESLGCFNHG